MRKVLIYLILLLVLFIGQIRPAAAKQIQIKSKNSAGIISCFSGGREILRKEIVSGPFADEYKFAHEVTVRDRTGEHNLNFAGGLCIIDRGEVFLPKELAVTDNLSCYSGMLEVVVFEVHGRETTVDEYVEGRTFFAKAHGIAFNSNFLNEYLIFGNDACIGEEVN
ncbi:conserved hypothetical protein [Hyella patelloides LEGE 07179]|uniref:Uncharacterized protein n=1 Tax=Hyella patelloides LEGE 07179 TaxID=945734 RepID=A0A563VJR8_9CYAN|nr:hypothetical protein [Hyella patelloides]VEP11700.1 conserved hypothetical protein [Hyella patelloides LEGE 07179]